MRRMSLFLAVAMSLSLAATVQAANYTYTFGEQRVNLGWPHLTADYHNHTIPSLADASYFDLNARYAFFLKHGREHLTCGLKRAAVEDLACAVSLEPYQPYARRLLAHALLGVGDYVGAAEQIRRACHLSYNFQRLEIHWKDYSASKQDYQNDLEGLRQACARDPRNTTLLYLLGVYRYFDEAYGEAKLPLERAQLLDPSDQDIRYFVQACHRKLH